MRTCLFLAALVVLASCDATIDTPPSLRGTYTLWGALDPTSDTQAVRVVAVTDTLLAQSPAPLPVTVTSTDLATGEETVWRDSLVTFRDGSVRHIYGARVCPDYGSRHRLVVRRRDDGREVTVTTTVPPRVEPFVRPNDLNRGARAPIVWPGAPQLAQLRVEYVVRKFNTLVAGRYEVGSLCDLDSVSFPLVADPGRVGSDWVTNVDLTAARARLYGELAEAPLPDLNLPAGMPRRRYELGIRRIRVTTEILSEDWRPPGGVFDFETLAASEVLDNVAGGFGFVGGGYRIGFTFKPSRRDLDRAGFFDTDRVCPPVR